MSRPYTLVLPVLALALAACSTSGDPAPQAQPAANEPAAPPQAEGQEPTQPPASDGGRDLEAVNLCDLIPNEEVAGWFAAEPTRGNLEGASGPSCIYQITPDGGSTVHNIYVSLVGTDLAEVSLTLARDEGGEVIPGLADESLILYADDEQQFHLIGIRRGDFGFEIAAPEEQGAIRLAEAILDRLSP
jgi:hypothetical protein